jgi:hypothetical protein
MSAERAGLRSTGQPLVPAFDPTQACRPNCFGNRCFELKCFGWPLRSRSVPCKRDLAHSYSYPDPALSLEWTSIRVTARQAAPLPCRSKGMAHNSHSAE